MKKSYLLITCTVLTLLTGCTSDTRETTTTSNGNTPPAIEEQSTPDTPAIEPETQAEKEYTIAEICSRFRESDDTIQDIYESPAFFWVTINDQDYYYWRTYPSNSWTVEEVADYYRECYYLWGDDPVEGYGNSTKYYLWTPDYEHEFIADTENNWLYIDGIKSAPLDKTVYSMNPKDLIEAFQNKEWDGITRRFSNDFSTYATVVPDYGILEYNFHTEYLSKNKDPNGLAYTGYANAKPWWQNNLYDTVIMHDSAYIGNHLSLAEASYSSFGKTDGNDNYDFYSENYGAWAIAYVDVPWDKQDELWAVQSAGDTYPDTYVGESAKHALYAQRTSDGLYAIVDTGVELWRAGRLRQSWHLKITDDSYLCIDSCFDNRNFIYTDGKLYELLDDGTLEIVIDNIVSTNLGYVKRYICCCFTLSDNGTLCMCGIDEGEVIQMEIATNSIAADLSNELLVLYTDNSGKTYAIYDFLGSDAGMMAIPTHRHDYEIACLGEGSIEFFKELYETQKTEKDGNLSQEEFIANISTAYLTK